MKRPKATTGIFAIATTIILAAMMIIAPAMTTLAANSSPHHDPDPPFKDGPIWIDYVDKQHVIMNPANAELLQKYINQTGKTNAGPTSITIYKGNRSDKITDALVYTDYPERDTIIADSSRNEMNLAYAEVTRAEGHMEKILPQVASIAAQKGFAIEDCSVAKFFDLTYYLVNPDFVYSRDYRRVHIELNDDNIEDKFVCLLHRMDGAWTVVDNAHVTGSTLTFEATALSPFALVVADIGSAFDSDGKQSPKTGDNTLTWAATAIGGLMLLLGAGYVLIRKKNA